jgi:hypothetical protein
MRNELKRRSGRSEGVRIMSVVQTHVEPRVDQRRVWIIFSGLMLALLIASLDQTIVATALPTIVSDLGGLNQLSWVVTGYLLASTVSTPLWANWVIFTGVNGSSRPR